MEKAGRLVAWLEDHRGIPKTANQRLREWFGWLLVLMLCSHCHLFLDAGGGYERAAVGMGRAVKTELEGAGSQKKAKDGGYRTQ